MVKKISIASFLFGVMSELNILFYDFPVKEFSDGSKFATNEGYVLSVLKPMFIALPLILVVYRFLYIRKQGYITRGTKNAPSLARYVTEKRPFLSPLFVLIWAFAHVVLGFFLSVALMDGNFKVTENDITWSVIFFFIGEIFFIVSFVLEIARRKIVCVD